MKFDSKGAWGEVQLLEETRSRKRSRKTVSRAGGISKGEEEKCIKAGRKLGARKGSPERK